MKKLIGIIALAVTCMTGYSQTNTTVTGQIFGHFSPLLEATNWTVAPYLTYAPDAPQKVGGGVLAVYNINNYVGGGLGLDWLGQFNLVSGNITLKLPIRVNDNLTLVPFLIGGIATPLGGAGEDNGNVATIEGGGLHLASTKRLLGGTIGGGIAWVNWTGAGDYSGGHEQFFLSWRRSF